MNPQNNIAAALALLGALFTLQAQEQDNSQPQRDNT